MEDYLKAAFVLFVAFPLALVGALMAAIFIVSYVVTLWQLLWLFIRLVFPKENR